MDGGGGAAALNTAGKRSVDGGLLVEGVVGGVRGGAQVEHAGHFVGGPQYGGEGGGGQVEAGGCHLDGGGGSWGGTHNTCVSWRDTHNDTK